MFPKVVVATLTWNQKSEVLECLASLVKLDYPNYEIVVVDNGSTDGTFDAIRRAYPQVHIVKHLENLGCAEGVNGEIRYALQAGADYLFIIANDARVEPSTLTELVRVAERDGRIGTVFPKVYYLGSERRIWFAKGARFKEIDWLRGRFTGFVQNVEDQGDFDNEEVTELFPGGFCLVRMEAVRRAGFLDPFYFIYYDDADWLVRIYQAGFSGRYAPRARAWHKPSSALGIETESFYYYRTRNRLFFFKKFSPRVAFSIFFLYFLFEFFLRTLPGLYRSGWKPQMRAAFLGFIDFLRGKRGRRDFSQGEKGAVRRFVQRGLKQIKRRGQGLRFEMKQAIGQKFQIQVRVDWNLGDEIMAIPVYEAIKKKYPDSMIDAEVHYPELLKGNPFVDSINGKEEFRPDLLLDLHCEKRGESRIDHLSEIARVGSLTEPRVYLAEEEIKMVKNKWGLGPKECRIGVAASARWFSRQWERDKWISLIEHFIDRYKAEIFVLGKEEEPLPLGINLIGKTSVREAAALLSLCDLFVSPDSGLLHLSLAAGTPTVGLFGSLNPSYLISPRPHFIPVWSEVECRGCWSDGRMNYPDHCPKILPDCMTSIPVSRVVGAVEELLPQRSYAS